MDHRHPPLYSVFLSKLSACIFEWDAGDLALLREAKQAQLSAKGMSYADVSQHITRRELEKHCRRCTRGTDKTTLLIQALLRDSTGTVPAVLPDWYGEEGWAAAARLQMRPRLDVAGELPPTPRPLRTRGGGGGFNDIMIK